MRRLSRLLRRVDGYAVDAVMVGSQIIRQEISTPRQANSQRL